MQVAFNGLFLWALHLPMTTRVEFLHILGNLSPPMVLITKQLVHYVASLWAPPALSWVNHLLLHPAALAMPPGSGIPF